MKVERKSFGKDKNGRQATLFTLSNDRGMQAMVTDYGAILVSLMVPDQQGNHRDVVLGYDTIEGYYNNPSFFGATVGPCANRVANASFTIDGVTYRLDANENGNNLHSHKELGFHKRIWESRVTEQGVVFTIEDGDGALGFPGNKKLQVTYFLDEENGLILTYHGESDRRTVLNPTNHAYFNLKGQGQGSIEDHELWLGASCYTPVGKGSIPTGEILPVAGTPLDFTKSKIVGKEIDASYEQVAVEQGYDHNWVIDGWDGSLRHFATLWAPDGGLRMEAYTTLPGVQFYSGNAITPEKGKGGAAYTERSGLCLETQYYPNSVNQPNFPSCIFGEDQNYDSVTVYRFF